MSLRSDCCNSFVGPIVKDINKNPKQAFGEQCTYLRALLLPVNVVLCVRWAGDWVRLIFFVRSVTPPLSPSAGITPTAWQPCEHFKEKLCYLLGPSLNWACTYFLVDKTSLLQTISANFFEYGNAITYCP
jgi:hypothetical protein